MHSRTLSLTLAFTCGALLLGAPLQAQGKGSDKGHGAGQKGSASANRGKGQGNSGNAARKENPGQGRGRAQPSQERSSGEKTDRGRGNDDDRVTGNERGNGSRGNRGAASAFGRGRAAEVRESGGDVVGRARPGNASRGRGEGHIFMRDFDPSEVNPLVRGFAVSDRMSERLAGRAVALAFDRGVDDAVLIVRPVDDGVRVLNQSGLVLLDLDDARARNLGSWRVVTVRNPDDDDRDGSPAFCRSGAGHPVWGRQWCLDKGFGLGVNNDVRWGRAIEVEDVVLRPTVRTGDLTRDVLLTVLGDVVFDRLAAHAITLGLVDPLVGRWAVNPDGRRVLLVNAGSQPVAEIVDADADNRADVLLVALRPW